MNILLYTDADVFAGTERHILDLATGLRILGASATIACPRPGALATRADQAQIPVLVIPKIGSIDRNAIHLLAGRLRAGTFDIIHAHNGRTHIAAAAAVRKAGCGVCITTQHFLAPARTTRTGIKALIAAYLHRRAAKSTAHTIAISDAVRSAALARGDDLPERITTVHNGIAPPDLTGAPDPHYVRSALGLSPGAPFIFCAARLQKEKDLPSLIAAMPAVLARHPAAQCFIAGEGDQRATLQGQIGALQLAGGVRLLGFRNDIPALLRAADLFVLPSLAEPFGLVLLEAMALAKPVIATWAGGPPEIVDHQKTGLLVPPRDPAALAQAITQLLSDEPLRAAMGQAAEARYQSHFTVDQMSRKILAIYEQALGKR